MLAELLRTLRIEFAAWPDRALELDVFGTDDPAIIVRELLRFTREQLSASIAGSLFYGSSVGCTFGLELSDGRRVVIKARPNAEEHSELTPRLSALEQISEAMHFLRTRGYPCPEPILAPRRLGRGFATVEAYLAEGVLMDGFEPAVRRALAAALAELLELLRAYDGPRDALRSMAVPPGRLFPKPHSPLFDFEKSAERAGWIDGYAERARALLTPSGALVLGHSDWRVEHVRFAEGRITTVYDWDSLAIGGETDFVAGAAHGFPCNWSTDVGRRVPNVGEMQAFIEDYEAVRGRAFSLNERRAVFARCLYSLAYGARCAHSRAPNNEDWSDDDWVGVLSRSGETLLALALGR